MKKTFKELDRLNAIGSEIEHLRIGDRRRIRHTDGSVEIIQDKIKQFPRVFV